MSKLDYVEFMKKLTTEEQNYFAETVLRGVCFYCKKPSDYPNQILLPNSCPSNPSNYVIYPICNVCDNDKEIVRKIENGLTRLHMDHYDDLPEEEMN